MNMRCTSLLVILGLGLTLPALPTMAAPQIKEVSGLKMEVDVIERQPNRKAPRAARSSKPKEIVVVGSKAPKSRDPQMAAWHELVIMGDVAAALK
jgi:hypothetical protein